MQQNHYYCVPTFCWLYNIKNSYSFNLTKLCATNFLLFAFAILFFYLLNIKLQFYYIILFLFCIYLLIIAKFVSNQNIKKKLVKTKRIKRLYFTFNLIFSVLCFCCLFLFYKINVLYSLLIIPILFLGGGVVVVSNMINLPLENLIKQVYILKAKNKLKKFNNLIVIGITGSYGKTSTKNYLCEMLKTKYNVLCTPASYNTPMGITRTILENLKPYHEILILEMGADHTNDIHKLCKIIKPNISIITAVGKQHLKTFKSIDNIINTKFQLVTNTKLNGYFVTNTTNNICKLYFDNSPIQVFNVDYEGKAFAKINSINCDEKGMSIHAEIDGKNLVLTTKLLGDFNAINIMLGIVVAYKLNIPLNAITEVVSGLVATPNRLQLKHLNNGAILIDDSFNSNPAGATAAIKVLKMFNKKKVLITCGMVELGAEQYNENFKLGEELNDVDEILVVNSLNYEAIKNGVLSKNGNSPKLFKSFKEAYAYITKKLNSNYVVLIENDLTDSYITD